MTEIKTASHAWTWHEANVEINTAIAAVKAVQDVLCYERQILLEIYQQREQVFGRLKYPTDTPLSNCLFDKIVEDIGTHANKAMWATTQLLTGDVPENPKTE